MGRSSSAGKAEHGPSGRQTVPTLEPACLAVRPGPPVWTSDAGSRGAWPACDCSADRSASPWWCLPRSRPRRWESGWNIGRRVGDRRNPMLRSVRGSLAREPGTDVAAPIETVEDGPTREQRRLNGSARTGSRSASVEPTSGDKSPLARLWTGCYGARATSGQGAGAVARGRRGPRPVGHGPCGAIGTMRHVSELVAPRFPQSVDGIVESKRLREA